MRRLLDRFAALSFAQRIALIVGVPILLGGGYYFAFCNGLLRERTALTQENQRLERERSSYQARHRQLLAFRNETTDLVEERKELLRPLPRKDEVDGVLQRVEGEVASTHLLLVTAKRASAVPEEMYLRIPLRMTLDGEFHRLVRYFHELSTLKHLVTVDELELRPDRASTDGKNTLRAEFVGSTYELVDEEAAPARPPGARRP